MTDQPIYTADEFARESQYLETIVWEAIVVEPDTKVLFCGYGPDGEQVARAVAQGAQVSVIEHREAAIARFADLGAQLLRGSTSVIPAKENAFDLAIAFHYLHEVDPFFHAQVLSELARVARRVAVVEPAPPADALGKRIVLLYSQAKRELGQFEYYQPLEYWKKLLQAVKADISQHVFAFAKVPPREYLTDTVELLLDTIAAEDAPESYIDELRQIARRSREPLLPPQRYVLLGASLGELPAPAFSARVTPPEPVPVPAVAPAAPAAAAASKRSVSAEAGYEFPPLDAPKPPAPKPKPGPAPKTAAAPPKASATAPAEPAFGIGNVTAEPPPAFVPGLPFGAPSPPEATFGAPFAVPAPDRPGIAPAGIAPPSEWQWEPPESADEGEIPFGPGPPS